MVVISVLSPDRGAVDAAASRVASLVGNVYEEIGPLAFEYTSYYEQEMGPGICRWFWALAETVYRERLVDIKLLTNSIEDEYRRDGRRRFNLDPGILALENFVLATGKNRAHRIYLGRGIFAELTYVFRKGRYRPLEWTYPDYASKELVDLFGGLRERHKWRLMRQDSPARSEA